MPTPRLTATPRPRPLLAPTLLALCLFGLAGCGPDAAPAPAAPPAPAQPVLNGTRLEFPADHPQLAQIGIATAQPASAQVVELPARLVWNEDRTQRIQPALGGRVDRIVADVGQAVHPGSVLAQLASPEFGLAQADAAKARVDVAHSQKAVQRLRELHEAGVAARKDLEQAEADEARARAELQRTEARTRMYGGGAGIDQRLALTASIHGVVVERNLTPGQELRADAGGAPAPFVISDPASLWVQIDARETELDVLRPGAPFELVVPTLAGETFRGTVSAVADAIDPSSRTIKVRGLVANPQRRLKAEMLATAHITRAPADAVVVPAAAVQLRGSAHSVMVQSAPGAFEPREVKLGRVGPQEVTVLRGLRQGEQVVTDNVLLLARQYNLAADAAPRTPPTAEAAPAAASGQQANARGKDTP